MYIQIISYLNALQRDFVLLWVNMAKRVCLSWKHIVLWAVIVTDQAWENRHVFQAWIISLTSDVEHDLNTIIGFLFPWSASCSTSHIFPVITRLLVCFWSQCFANNISSGQNGKHISNSYNRKSLCQEPLYLILLFALRFAASYICIFVEHDDVFWVMSFSFVQIYKSHYV